MFVFRAYSELEKTNVKTPDLAMLYLKYEKS